MRPAWVVQPFVTAETPMHTIMHDIKTDGSGKSAQHHDSTMASHAGGVKNNRWVYITRDKSTSIHSRCFKKTKLKLLVVAFCLGKIIVDATLQFKYGNFVKCLRI